MPYPSMPMHMPYHPTVDRPSMFVSDSITLYFEMSFSENLAAHTNLLFKYFSTVNSCGTMREFSHRLWGLWRGGSEGAGEILYHMGSVASFEKAAFTLGKKKTNNWKHVKPCNLNTSLFSSYYGLLCIMLVRYKRVKLKRSFGKHVMFSCSDIVFWNGSNTVLFSHDYNRNINACHSHNYKSRRWYSHDNKNKRWHSHKYGRLVKWVVMCSVY